jgi:hypothetical protein
VTYAIVAGNTAAAFYIEATSGGLFVARELDRETLASLHP